MKMTTLNTNKLKTKTKNKILVLGLILLVLVGSWVQAPQAEAQISSQELGTCVSKPVLPTTSIATTSITTSDDCPGLPLYFRTWTSNTPKPVDPDKTAFKQALDSRSCAFNILGGGTWSPIEGCLRELAYYLFFAIPAGILWVVAQLFNVILALTISSTMYGSFIGEAWTVVRDLSNIFFIVILLYAAIEMILGIGHGAKKTIGTVVVMALLINFSMFFTRVVIDSSNILALVFYNKIQIDGNSTPPISGATLRSVDPKDIGGNLMGAFNITKSMQPEMFDKEVSTFGFSRESLKDTTSLMITIILIAGAIFLFASYAFFIAGLSFVGRLVELWVLLIFSPFAFMSYALPILSHVPGIGWKNWLERLLAVSFMAPVFMFFMYLIAKISNAKFLPSSDATTAFLPMLLLIIIPSMIYIILLMKATEYAKKGSGQLGGAMIGAGKAAVGLAVGGTALTAAFAGRKTVGGVAKSVQASDTKRTEAMTFKDTRDTWNTMNKANPFAYVGLAGKAIGGAGKAATAGVAQVIHTIPGTGGKTLGEHAQAADKAVAHKDHAEHTISGKISEMHEDLGVEKDTKYSDLSDSQKAKVKKSINEDIISKAIYNRKFSALTNNDEIESIKNAIIGIKPDGKMDFTVDKLERDPRDPNKFIRKNVIKTDVETADNIETDAGASKVIGTFVQALRKGTYDIRNLPDASTKLKGFGPKLTVGLIAAAATGIRLGIKTSTGVGSFGTPQKDFFGDLKNTFTEAIKNIKVDVGGAGNVTGGGGHGGGDKKGGHGGGGGHH